MEHEKFAYEKPELGVYRFFGEFSGALEGAGSGDGDAGSCDVELDDGV